MFWRQGRSQLVPAAHAERQPPGKTLSAQFFAMQVQKVTHSGDACAASPMETEPPEFDPPTPPPNPAAPDVPLVPPPDPAAPPVPPPSEAGAVESVEQPAKQVTTTTRVRNLAMGAAYNTPLVRRGPKREREAP